MSSTPKTGLDSEGPSAATTPGSRSHFDTFETKFFEQGDNSSEIAVEVEHFDDLDGGPRAKRRPPARQLTLAIAIGGASLAVLGCVALLRGGHRSNKPTGETVAQAQLAPAEPAMPPPSVPTQAAPSVAPAPTEQPVVAAPAAPAAPSAPVAAAPVPSATEPVAAVPSEPAPAPAAAPAPEVPQAKASDSFRDDCEKAIKAKHTKEILSACAEAFAADPSAAALAVAVARVEYDRGHSAQALAWSKKAIAADPDVADAYVFIGGAEQTAGHGKAAKEAYRRYLQLAPGGRYAADLRAIVGRL
jgi:hypothetical protein